MTYKQIVKLFVPTMSKYGFVLNKGFFYKKSNNILFAISFEKPSKLLYCTFFLIPLWVPTDTIYYTYGNRINNLEMARVAPLNLDSSCEQVTSWVDNISDALEATVFPLFETIRTPRGLLSYLNEVQGNTRGLIFCPPDKMDVLKINLLLFLEEYDAASREIICAKKRLSKMDCYTDRVKEEMLMELQKLQKLISENQEHSLHAHFKKIICDNCRLFSI